MIESRVVRKLSVRLLPILVISYFIAIIDRANLGVAALTMNADLHIDPAAFGIAASVFFIPYVILEVPSNLALARFGARWWLARIMLTWGIFAGLHAIVWNVASLYVMRGLLGAAEAGFYPGVIFYIALWFPAKYRGRFTAWFLAAIPIALIIGTPLSGLLLKTEGFLGLHGWQWVYLIEGIPAIVVAILIPIILPKDVGNASFLDADERTWLANTLAQEKAVREAAPTAKHRLRDALLSPQVIMFAVAYYGLTNLNGAVSTFLPQILKPIGLDNTSTTFIAVIPYIFGLVGILVLGRLADRPGKRAVAVYVGLVVAFVGLLAAGLIHAPVAQLVALCVASFGFFGVLPTFWGLPTAILSGAAAAGGVALINALGNISSIVNPAVIGEIKQHTGDFGGGLLWLAAMALLAMVALGIVLRVWKPTKVDAAIAAAGSQAAGLPAAAEVD